MIGDSTQDKRQYTECAKGIYKLITEKVTTALHAKPCEGTQFREI